MAFDKKGFTPVHVNAGPIAPRIFTYCNMNETLKQIMEPGYFNLQKIIMRPNSFVKVVCKDTIAELVVEKNTGQVTFKEEMTVFSKRKAVLRKPKRKPRKKLAKTG